MFFDVRACPDLSGLEDQQHCVALGPTPARFGRDDLPVLAKVAD